MALSFDFRIKMVLGILGFLYIILVLFKVENIKISISKQIHWKAFRKDILLKLFLIAIITTLFVYFVDGQNLFKVLLNKPFLWLFILFVYSVFSVYPQELVYRTFFFKRYQSVFSSDALFIFVNAIIFSLAHLFFKNTLVIVLTFCGGLLFAYTYRKTQSTILVTIEHAVYGCWLFTVGMGDMLGFPS
jgi:membrane protease YdiL (CAAX protease family)